MLGTGQGRRGWGGAAQAAAVEEPPASVSPGVRGKTQSLGVRRVTTAPWWNPSSLSSRVKGDLTATHDGIRYKNLPQKPPFFTARKCWCYSRGVNPSRAPLKQNYPVLTERMEMQRTDKAATTARGKMLLQGNLILYFKSIKHF